jgi:biopolymer transport protein ExbD
MSAKRIAIQEDITPNLIPMIDIMFLLLLFFMLGADMGQRDLEEVVLPTADKVQEDPNLRGEGETTTVNVHHRHSSADFSCPVNAAGAICREDDHWRLAIRAKDFTTETVRKQLQEEADASLEDQVDREAGKRLSRRKVMIRADRFAPYGLVQRLIEVCGLVGIYKVEVGAAQPPKK